MEFLRRRKISLIEKLLSDSNINTHRTSGSEGVYL